MRKNHFAENQLVITERGGLNPGTWLNEDLALETIDEIIKGLAEKSADLFEESFYKVLF